MSTRPRSGYRLELSSRLVAWNSRYDDAELPFERNDLEWLDDGARPMTEVGAAPGGEHDVIVTEPWWGEQQPRA